MYFKAVVIALLFNAVFARILQVRNIGSVPLVVSVTGQNEITVLSGATALVTVAEDFSGSVSAIPSDSENTDVPRTKVELTLNAAGDTYAVSLVDGFNLKAKVVPINGINCIASVCTADLIRRCPLADQVTNSLGVAVACKNSPLVFRTICPKAVVTSEDTLNVLTCQASSYRILLG